MTDTANLPRFHCLSLQSGTPTETADMPARTVLCLGNFDGVHVAHAALIAEGIRLARTLTCRRGEPIACGVLCFRRPSSDFFRAPDAPPHHLTTLDEKLTRLSLLGADYAVLADFEEVRALEPEAFLTILQDRLGCVGVACGFNHRFGAGARGDASLLAHRFGEAAVTRMPPVTVDGVVVSSSAIRDRLWTGDAAGAARLLGRPYALTSPVTTGKQLGRTIGFPTANQAFPTGVLIPAHGVYAARCRTEAGVFPAVANVGSHPTVDAHAPTNCESYLIGYTGDLYGRTITTELLAYLRPEEKFPDVEALAAAIAHDAEVAEAYLRAHDKPL